ncbi:50S ribosomal protein L20 [candidate division WOR-3 bacterium]|nr:50S ribosomal protein L20 [candidate division WOR-3 bacterium]
MPRVKTGAYTKQRRKKWLKAARGYFGGRSKLYKSARHQVMHALVSAYRERRKKKRRFRAQFITRINAGIRPLGINYSSFIHGLKLAGIEIDRSVLAEMAVVAPEDLGRLVELAKEELAAAAPAAA